MLPKSAKKVVVVKAGSHPHECLKIVEMPLTAPHAHEIVVKNYYAGVNTTDVARMMGLDGWAQAMPFDFGIEAIGEVIAIGDKIEDFKIGDKVATALYGNGYHEYSIIDRNFALKIPALDPKYVGLFISGTIAKIAFDFVADIQAHETVMVTAALGSSGHFAVQLAKVQNCYVIGICANAEEAAILEQFGLDRIINRSQEDVFQVLADDYHGMLNIVFDTMGGDILNACIEHTAPRARVILVEALREHLNGEVSKHEIDIYHKIIRRSVALIGFNLGDYANAVPIESRKLLDQLQLGLIQSIVDPTAFDGMESIPDAIAHLMTGRSRGKVVVKF